MPIDCDTQNHSEDFCLVYITTCDLAEAQSIARAVISERLAACANILGAIQSLYWWDGDVQQEPEYALLLKTRKDLFSALKDRICGLHSYECPCVIALPIREGHAPFLNWIGQQTQSPA